MIVGIGRIASAALSKGYVRSRRPLSAAQFGHWAVTRTAGSFRNLPDAQRAHSEQALRELKER